MLRSADWSLASRIDEVLAALPSELADRAAAETHGSALELASRPHRTVAAAIGELASCARARRRPGAARAARGRLRHASVRAVDDVEVSPGARFRAIYDSMASSAARADVRAAIHVAVPDAGVGGPRASRPARARPAAARAVANSPVWQGRDTGLASARVPIFGTFPRVGIPRRFGATRSTSRRSTCCCAAGRSRARRPLVGRAATPKFGTIEVRIMDAQTRMADSAALATLVQCAVRLRRRWLRRRGDRGAARGARREPLPRDARRDAGGVHRPAHDRRRPVRDDPRRAARRLRAPRRRARLRGRARRGRGARRRARRPSPADPGRCHQGDPVGPGLGLLVSALAADFSAGARPAEPRSRAGSARTP